MVNWPYSTYSKINPEVEKFFPFKKAREFQLETISEIYEAMEKGYKYIVLEAGTGTGKSAIAATLALMSKSAYILTITKQLQQQYMEDFAKFNFALVKGRGNFKCLSYSKYGANETCEVGRCKLEPFNCPHKVNQYTINKNSKENCCKFEYQKSIGVLSDVVVANYSFAYYDFNFSEGFNKRDLLIFDEAHNLENQIMKLFSLEFSRKDLKEEARINLSKEVVNKLINGNYIDWIEFIKKVRDKYSERVQELKPMKNDKHIAKLLNVLNTNIDDYNKFLKNIKEHPNDWLVDYDAHHQILEFKPLKVDKFAKKALLRYGDVCLFMSATILDYKLFAKWLGINPDEIYAIRRKSPFDVTRNPIKTYSGFTMTYGNLSISAPKTVPVIKDILKEHKDEKGLIHTVSYSCKKYLKSKLNNDRLIDHKTYNRERVLSKFKKSNKPLVLISPSMNQGVDLPENQCRFQIMYKIPYPSLGDKQTKLRTNMEDEWYAYQTVLNLLQTYGRGMRSQKDYCKTYFIDSRIWSYIKKDENTYNFIPDYFKEALDAVPADVSVYQEDKLINVNNIQEIIDGTTKVVSDDNCKLDSSSVDNGSVSDDNCKMTSSSVDNNDISDNDITDVSKDNLVKNIIKSSGLEDYFNSIEVKIKKVKTRNITDERREISSKFKKAYKERRYEEALEYYKELNKFYSKNSVTCYRKFANLYRQVGDYEKELIVIKSYFFDNNIRKTFSSEKFFIKRLEEVLSLISNKSKDRVVLNKSICIDSSNNLVSEDSIFNESSNESVETFTCFDTFNLKRFDSNVKFEDNLTEESKLISNKLNRLKNQENISKADFKEISDSIKENPNFKDERKLAKYSNGDIDNSYSQAILHKKFSLKEKGRKFEFDKEKKDLSQAISFYKSLKNNSYFSEDYYPYRRLGIIYKKLDLYTEDLLNIDEFFSNNIYCTNHQIVWFRNKLIELEDIYLSTPELFDSSKVNRKLFLEIHEKIDNYIKKSIKPNDSKIPMMERLYKNDDGKIDVISNDKFEFIQHIYELKEYCAGFERRKEYDLLIKELNELYKEDLFYFKYYSIYRLSMLCNKMSQSELTHLFKSIWDV